MGGAGSIDACQRFWLAGGVLPAWGAPSPSAFPGGERGDPIPCCHQQQGATAIRTFRESAGEYRLARFFLMRQVADIFCAMAFLSLAADAGKVIDTSLDAPDFRGFHRRILASHPART